MAFIHTLRVRFHEADPAGITFFANVLTYCHTAYEELLREGGVPLDALLAAGQLGFPLVHAEADYQRPCVYGALVRVTVTVVGMSERRFTLSHVLQDEAGVTLATGKTVHVCVDRAAMRPAALPENLRKVLAAHAVEAS